MPSSGIYRRIFWILCLNFYIFILSSINLIHGYILIINIYIDMTKENNPTIVVGNDDKKDESKKEDFAKKEK